MQLSQWRSSGHFLNVDGQQVFYKTEGTGPVLLLIHGYPTASFDWAKIWPKLTTQFHCVTLDMPGFGFSDKSPKKYLIKEQADAISEVIRHLGITSAHVLSHDYGDTVAQEMMAQQLENNLAFNIESLHLLNGGLFPETHRALPIQKLLLSPIGGLLIRFLNKNAIRKSMHNIFGSNTPPSDQDIDDFWTLISANNGHQHMHLLLDYMKQRKQYRERWVSALQNANAPLRLTAGMADPISGAHMVARYKQLIPNADVIELDQIGHYPQIESAEAVVNSIASFLGRYAN
ncbi:MAG TPA: alpha/beta hydrolase [Alteromonas macleodii]|nr:alpha/beta hydrolase [Alteromonas macleodii]NKX32050.1 alpha/beta hydrolase [Alteromonadaceae bacterium A_SAG1]HBO00646.1 alpha/beta hydrolase [Alteromonas macleodii]HCY27524.1 alpha/beta hydrolase [Alteromonas macleodii]|tara:strand:- start:1479 stop:2342 length:864 start_codon:yes stop_codon:yes gene_type:complete